MSENETGEFATAKRLFTIALQVTTLLTVSAVTWLAIELRDLHGRVTAVETTLPMVEKIVNNFHSMHERVTVIEANRYTPKDALAFERDVNGRLNGLTQQVANVSGELALIREILNRIDKKLHP